MKHLPLQILSLVLSIELILAPFPKTPAFANTTNASSAGVPETSPDEFIKTTLQEYESLSQCATINENGELKEIHNSTSGDAIHGPADEASSQDCLDRLQKFQPKWEKMLEIREKATGAKRLPKNESCADCSTPKTPEEIAKNGTTEGSICTAKEKQARVSERKNNPSCSLWNNLKAGDWTSLSSTVKQNSTNVATCVKDMAMAFVGSYKAMWATTKLAWGKVKSVFTSNKQIEESATLRNQSMSQMSDKEVKEAQADPQKATQNFLQKMISAVETSVSWLLENVAGLSVGEYKEQWKCAACDQRANSLCKIIGVMGKDIINNAVLWIIGGKIIEGLGGIAVSAGKKLLPKAGALLAKAGTNVLEHGGENATARLVIEWGAKKAATVSAKSIGLIDEFLATKAGKGFATFMKTSAKVGWKYVIKPTGEVVLKGAEVFDKVVNYPTRLLVEGGESLAQNTKSAVRRLGVFQRTPGIAENAAKDTVVTTTAKIAESTAPLVVELDRPMTKKMAAAESRFSKTKGADGERLDSEDINNVTKLPLSEVRVNPNRSGLIVSNEHYIKINKPETVTAVHSYGKGEDPLYLIEKNDGSIAYAKNVVQNDGSSQFTVLKNFSTREASGVKALIDPSEHAKAAQMLVEETRLNAKANGLKEVPAANASELSDAKKVVVKPEGEGCGDTPIVIKAL